MCVLIQARKGSDERPAAAFPKMSRTDSAAGTSQTKRKGSTSEDVIDPTPKKDTATVKASSKLAMMKKKKEERDDGSKGKRPVSPTKMIISPKKEALASSNSDKKVTPKAGSAAATVKTSPEKPEVSKHEAQQRDVNMQRIKKIPEFTT